MKLQHQIQDETCTLDGCLADTAYGLIDPIQGKLHRISFSQGLLEHIKDNNSEWSHLRLCTIRFRLGRELKRNETSSTGIYAIVKAKNNWTLRISLIKDVANYICDFETRKIRECIISEII